MIPKRIALLSAAPLAVAVPLIVFHDVFAVFALYHIGICLLVPAFVNLAVRRLGMRGHLSVLALTGPGSRRGFGLGLILAGILAAGTLVAFKLFGHVFLADQDIAGTLAAWGAGPERHAALFWFMILVNGPAEELYWRGFVHHELVPVSKPGPCLSMVAAGYASYHAVTVQLLVGSVTVSLLFLAAIWGAGLAWGWLREKTGSVWPPLLGHAGATIAYMIVARPYLFG